MTFANPRHATLQRVDPYPDPGAATNSLYRAPAAPLTAGGSANTKGSWVEQITSTAFDVAVIELWTNDRVGVNGSFRGMLLDVGVGGSGSEVVVAENMVVGDAFGGGEFQQSWRIWLPIRIVAGTRVAMRIQASLASDTFEPVMMVYYGTAFGRFRGFNYGVALSLNPGSSSYPTTGNLSNNAWTQVVASTTERYRGLSAHFCTDGATGTANGTITCDVGVGGAGSEVAVGQYVVQMSNTETIVAISGPPWINVDVPIGSRLALRKNSTNVLGGTITGWRF